MNDKKIANIKNIYYNLVRDGLIDPSISWKNGNFKKLNFFYDEQMLQFGVFVLKNNLKYLEYLELINELKKL